MNSVFLLLCVLQCHFLDIVIKLVKQDNIILFIEFLEFLNKGLVGIIFLIMLVLFFLLFVRNGIGSILYFFFLPIILFGPNVLLGLDILSLDSVNFMLPFLFDYPSYWRI